MNKLLDWLGQQKDYGILLARVVLAVILITAGYSKFAGPGIGGVTGYFESINLFAAPLLGFLVPILELAGGIAILLGIGSRLLSLWVIVQFFLIVVYIKPVLMQAEWSVIRTDLLLLTFGVLIATNGPGALALGRKLLPGKLWAE